MGARERMTLRALLINCYVYSPHLDAIQTNFFKCTFMRQEETEHWLGIWWDKENVIKTNKYNNEEPFYFRNEWNIYKWDYVWNLLPKSSGETEGGVRAYMERDRQCWHSVMNKYYLQFTMMKVFKTNYTYAKRKLIIQRLNTTGYLETCLYLMLCHIDHSHFSMATKNLCFTQHKVLRHSKAQLFGELTQDGIELQEKTLMI